MQIKPFKAFRFNPDAVGNVGDCVAPPYDVISSDLQQRLYEKSRYNIVRIIKGKTTPSDNGSSNQYTRAAEYLNNWIEKAILKQDQIETIYAYVQDFELAGAEFQRFNFIALAKLEEFGKTVRPHEQTLKGPMVDRLNLKRATGAKFGLPFMLYEDERAIADKIIERAASQKPLIDFSDENNVRHRLFAITADDDIDAITEMMLDKSCIIADGHHRYTTALTYAKESNNPAAGYQMIAFANIRHDGLIVLANHRLVGNLPNFSSEKLLAELKENFEVIKTDSKRKMLAQMKAEHNRDKIAFGIYLGNNTFYVAVLKDKKVMDWVVPEKSAAWRSLDVAVLHKLILEKLLGIDEKKLASQSNLEYVKDANNAIDESIAKVNGGQKQAAFFVNPVKMQQLKTVTDAGERMPQKSTYFYPKIYTGLTINKL
ncbi:MAG: DUF1015 domain-containing protein [Planctomycetota bacterium]|nr:MAG: DUF1015 domain-containing protein [Planctomycetota bacterium]